MNKFEIKQKRAELVLRGQARRGGRLGGSAYPWGKGRATLGPRVRLPSGQGSGYISAEGRVTLRRHTQTAATLPEAFSNPGYAGGNIRFTVRHTTRHLPVS